MRVELKKLLETLGVSHLLSPYETFPWLFYDPERGITCSAEVRMGPDGQDIEAEIQFLYDEGREPVEPESQIDPETNILIKKENFNKIVGGQQQIMRLAAYPTDSLWSPKYLHIKGQDYANKVHNWEEKGCNFFRRCVESLQMSEIPNIDDLLEKEFGDDDDWADAAADVSAANPLKSNPPSFSE